MTNTNTAASQAAPATDSADQVNTSEPFRKRLKALSEADKKPAESSMSSARSKKAYGIESANVPVSSDASEAEPEQSRQTKASVVEALLIREGGASLNALCEATGWQTHTCRAFLTGLRKTGKEVIRASDKDGKSIYLIATDRAPAPSPIVQHAEAESA